MGAGSVSLYRFHKLLCLIVKVLVLQCSPVHDEQSVGIVLRARDVLDLPHGDEGSLHVLAAALDELCAVVLELTGVLVELYGVTDDGAHGARGDDVRVEAVLLHGLLLLQGRAVSHIHGLAKGPLDEVVIGREIEEILVEELYVRLGLHDEIGLLAGALGKEGDVPVDEVDLLALVSDHLEGESYADAADDGAADDGQHHGHQGESCFLFQTFYKHDIGC